MKVELLQFYNNVTIILQNSGIPAKSMLSDLGMSKNFMTSLKKGTANPTFKTLLSVAEYLKVDLKFLLYGDFESCEFDNAQSDNFSLDKNERFLLKYYSLLDEETQADVLMQIANFASSSTSSLQVLTHQESPPLVPSNQPEKAPRKIPKAPPGIKPQKQKKAE